MKETNKIVQHLFLANKQYISKLELLQNNTNCFCMNAVQAKELFDLNIRVLQLTLYSIYPITCMMTDQPDQVIIENIKNMLAANKEYFSNPSNLKIEDNNI
jgi:hypothetical protein